MKRQTKETASRVFSYGTVPSRVAPVVGEEDALEQMRLGRRLWNVLVSVERRRMEGYCRIMHDDNQTRIDELKQQCSGIREAIRLARKTARKRSVELGDLPEQLAECKLQLKQAIDLAKETKECRHQERRADLEKLKERSFKRIKRARQAAASMGLFWGSYNDIVQRADTGRKQQGELRYKGFRGEGTVTAQIMGGASVERCVGGQHTFFQVDPPTEGQKWRYARIRIGSDGRMPKWLAIPIVYHREIPANADIKSVSATRRIVAGKIRWQLNVTVNLPVAPPKTSGKAIGIDIGWRLLPEGIRVAVWQNDRNENGQVLVNNSVLGEFVRVANLRSTCDKNRDEFIPALAEGLNGRELNEEWTRRSAYLSQWRSSDRLARLIRWWAGNRLDNDAELFEAAVEWRRRYLHLANFWRNLEDQLRLAVREQYRIFAAGITREYAIVYLEDFDLSDVAKKPETEEESKGILGTYRHMVSPSVFRSALVNACRREGVQVVIVPAEQTTQTCHSCGGLCNWNQMELHHRCEFCGVLFDQDENAARNILARGSEVLTANQQDGPGPEGSPEDRSQSASEVVETT